MFIDYLRVKNLKGGWCIEKFKENMGNLFFGAFSCHTIRLLGNGMAISQRFALRVLEWFTSGIQIVLLLAMIPIVPLPIIYLMLTFPLLGLPLTFAFVFGFTCVTRSRWQVSS